MPVNTAIIFKICDCADAALSTDLSRLAPCLELPDTASVDDVGRFCLTADALRCLKDGKDVLARMSQGCVEAMAPIQRVVDFIEDVCQCSNDVADGVRRLGSCIALPSISSPASIESYCNRSEHCRSAATGLHSQAQQVCVRHGQQMWLSHSTKVINFVTGTCRCIRPLKEATTQLGPCLTVPDPLDTSEMQAHCSNNTQCFQDYMDITGNITKACPGTNARQLEYTQLRSRQICECWPEIQEAISLLKECIPVPMPDAINVAHYCSMARDCRFRSDAFLRRINNACGAEAISSVSYLAKQIQSFIGRNCKQLLEMTCSTAVRAITKREHASCFTLPNATDVESYCKASKACQGTTRGYMATVYKHCLADHKVLEATSEKVREVRRFVHGQCRGCEQKVKAAAATVKSICSSTYDELYKNKDMRDIEQLVAVCRASGKCSEALAEFRTVNVGCGSTFGDLVDRRALLLPVLCEQAADGGYCVQQLADFIGTEVKTSWNSNSTLKALCSRCGRRLVPQLYEHGLLDQHVHQHMRILCEQSSSGDFCFSGLAQMMNMTGPLDIATFPTALADAVLHHPRVWQQACGMGGCLLRAIRGVATVLENNGNRSIALRLKNAAERMCLSYDSRQCMAQVKMAHVTFKDFDCSPQQVTKLATCPAKCKGAYEWRRGALGCCVVTADILMALRGEPGLASAFAKCSDFDTSGCAPATGRAIPKQVRIEGSYDWVLADPERAKSLVLSDLLDAVYPAFVEISRMAPGSVVVDFTVKGHNGDASSKEAAEGLMSRVERGDLTLESTQSAYAKDNPGQLLVVVESREEATPHTPTPYMRPSVLPQLPDSDSDFAVVVIVVAVVVLCCCSSPAPVKG
eukprot:NODE_33_length_3198_cov_75.303906_g30_i0.p1 GENE.NODE_33_length_3198_cov_75.303906_g30_i0~~NODE_33_length_3198_cov_75.303906_g30_i0.p1  ORF type:complete len:969 (+),score=242.22 NODE_33_length_3198_cov_75.303906_g30_i0:316-2907(+)